MNNSDDTKHADAVVLTNGMYIHTGDVKDIPQGREMLKEKVKQFLKEPPEKSWQKRPRSMRGLDL